MFWLFKNGCCLALLHYLASIHHDNTLGNLRDHSEIVGDQHNGCIEILFQLHHQINYLCLNRDIQGGCGFVSNQNFRITGKRHGDHGALPHAP